MLGRGTEDTPNIANEIMSMTSCANSSSRHNRPIEFTTRMTTHFTDGGDSENTSKVNDSQGSLKMDPRDVDMESADSS
jgi:hypothetical protein